MLLRLQRYSVDISYSPGPTIPVPDALPRPYMPHESIYEDLQSAMEVLVHSLVKNLDLSVASKSLMQGATITDNCPMVLQQLTQSGWLSERR